jgi:hypothetical protein
MATQYRLPLIPPDALEVNETLSYLESRPPDIRQFFRSESFCVICLVKAVDIGPYGRLKFS